jgi:hypothetical protein
MKRKRTRVRRLNARWILGGAAAALVLAGGLIVASLTPAKPAFVPMTSSALSSCGGPECGQPNAPVTIEIYSDFQ